MGAGSEGSGLEGTRFSLYNILNTGTAAPAVPRVRREVEVDAANPPRRSSTLCRARGGTRHGSRPTEPTRTAAAISSGAESSLWTVTRRAQSAHGVRWREMACGRSCGGAADLTRVPARIGAQAQRLRGRSGVARGGPPPAERERRERFCDARAARIVIVDNRSPNLVRMCRNRDTCASHNVIIIDSKRMCPF